MGHAGASGRAGASAMKRALVIRHAELETLAGNFTPVLQSENFQLEPLNIFEDAPGYRIFAAPPLEEISVIIALGGPMSANDDYPALRQEREYLKNAMAAGKPVLGICLGALMMATALGGWVEPSGGYQFGLSRLLITEEGAADPVFGKIDVPLAPTLHGECFSIPKDAVKLAEGHMLCRDGSYRRINMAFRYNDSYAFQFEPQLTLVELEIWDKAFEKDYELMGGQFDAKDESTRNLREFTKFAPCHESQMGEMLLAFLSDVA
jgi:GMP synthase (glutamine-hydrolysing)